VVAVWLAAIAVWRAHWSIMPFVAGLIAAPYRKIASLECPSLNADARGWTRMDGLDADGGLLEGEVGGGSLAGCDRGLAGPLVDYAIRSWTHCCTLSQNR
jgi:hypothetical protein